MTERLVNMKLLRMFLMLIIGTTVIFQPGCAKRKQMKVSKPIVSEAMKCMEMDNFPCAVEELTKAAKVNEHPEIYRLLGDAYRGRYDESFEKEFLYLEIEAYSKSFALDNKNLDTARGLAQAYFTATEYEQAKSYFEKALELNPPEYIKQEILYTMKECDKQMAPKQYYEEPKTYDE